MEFTIKGGWFIDGQNTPDTIRSTYSGGVLRESVHIAFTYATFNGIKEFVYGIKNAYLQAPSSQK